MPQKQKAARERAAFCLQCLLARPRQRPETARRSFAAGHLPLGGAERLRLEIRFYWENLFSGHVIIINFRKAS